MAYPHVDIDDSDATAFSLRVSYDSDKHDVPLSPTASELPELLKETVPVLDHEKSSSTTRKEDTSDGRPRPYPPVIPPDHGQGRTLVLCFDGTGDQFDADNSNIVQLVSLLKKDDRSKQLVYYQVRLSPQKKVFVVVRLTFVSLQRLVLARMTLPEIRQALCPLFAKYFSKS